MVLPPKPKPRYVRLRNRLSTPLTPSVLGENGRDVVPIKLGPRQTSAPVREDRLTSYTVSLKQQGRIEIL